MALFGSLSIAELVLRAITFLIAVAVHEFAHVFAADQMGDTTGREMGRLTLNPFVNIYWPGFVMAILIGFGPLGYAPVDERRMRNPRWGMLVAVLAGPVSNLLLAIVCAIPFWFGMQVAVPGPRDFVPTLPAILTRLVALNLILFIFNLIPLFPLDGWTILLKLLPPETAYSLSRYRNESTYVLFGLIILSYISPSLSILNFILGPPLSFLINILIPAKAFFGY